MTAKKATTAPAKPTTAAAKKKRVREILSKFPPDYADQTSIYTLIIRTGDPACVPPPADVKALAAFAAWARSAVLAAWPTATDADLVISLPRSGDHCPQATIPLLAAKDGLQAKRSPDGE
jgi:hypothetical protein